MLGLRFDGWQNILTGLGLASRDKRVSATIAPAVRFTREDLESLYAGDGLAKKITNLPAKAQTRKWLTTSIDGNEVASKAMKLALETLNAQTLVTEAMIWGRLYGGAILVLGVDDGQEPSAPLNEAAIRSFKWLSVLDRFELQIVERYSNPFAPKFGEPSLYKVQSALVDRGRAPVMDQQIHESRTIRFDGTLTPSYRRIQQEGWCDSIFVALNEAVRDFWTGYGGAAHLLSDFSQAVFKIKNLANLVGSNQDELVMKRLLALDMARSLVRAVVIDQDEEYARQTTPLTGLPDLLDRFTELVASLSGIPVTMLMGRAPAGLNATGDADIRNFYDEMASEQETSLRPKLERLLRLVLLSKDGPTRGAEPANWSFSFNPLWQMTAKEKAELRKLTTDADSLDITNQVLHPEEVRQSRYGSGQYSTETMLDPDFDGMAPMPGEEPPEDPNDPEGDPAPDPEA